MLTQNKIMEVGEVYFNKSDGKKLEIMNERSNRQRDLPNRNSRFTRGSISGRESKTAELHRI